MSFDEPIQKGWLHHNPTIEDTGMEPITIAFSSNLTLALEPLSLDIETEKPKMCALDVMKDSRCDDARSLLVGRSTSVGQTCSIAKAVSADPSKMPGTCCLDDIKTLQNFGERVSMILRSTCEFLD